MRKQNTDTMISFKSVPSSCRDGLEKKSCTERDAAISFGWSLPMTSFQELASEAFSEGKQALD